MSVMYAEWGVGNPTFLSTEVEEANGTEFRVKGFFVTGNILSVYVRSQIGYCVLIVESVEGTKWGIKPYCAFKFLFGIKSR